VCPGYTDKKPLTFLPPGQVMSRARKTKPNSKRNATCNGGRDRGSRRLPIRAPTSSTSSTFQSPGDPGDAMVGTGSDSRTEELDLPAPVELRPELCDFIEAMLYCTYNYHSTSMSGLIGPHVEVYMLSSSVCNRLTTRQLPHLPRPTPTPAGTQQLSDTSGHRGELPARHHAHARVHHHQPPDPPDG
jgi:hypothetical protein